MTLENVVSQQEHKQMNLQLDVQHGVVASCPDEELGYFGWPSLARLDNGRLLVASSGLRTAHICPWGKTVINVSDDHGLSWSESRVINDSPIDDRDAGVVNLGDNKVLVTWFTSDTRQYWNKNNPERSAWGETLESWTDELVNEHLGSWCMRSDDNGANWGEPIRVPATAPHGPIKLANGNLIYLGKRYTNLREHREGDIAAFLSTNDGQDWIELGGVPLATSTKTENYYEPHVVELTSGKLIGFIRVQNCRGGHAITDFGIPDTSIMQTESLDGGKTWSTAQALGFHAVPPHIMRHSSGVLVLTYARREDNYGQRVAFSHDEGQTWDYDYIIRDDGPDPDLGYPATVEMADGSLFTVYYQKMNAGEHCSLLWSKWKLPKFDRG